MSTPYRVDITIGPTRAGTTYSWSVDLGDAPVLPVILDGLRLGWQFPDSTLWPVQPDPTVAAFSILAAQASDLVGIDRGTAVKVRVWAGVTLEGDDYDTVTFNGRVATAIGFPRKFPDPADIAAGEPDPTILDGWQLDLTAADATADTGERVIAGYYQLQGVSTWGNLNGRFKLAGVANPAWGNGGDGSPLLTLNEGLIDTTTLRAEAEKLLRSYADGGTITGDPTIPANHARYNAEGWRRGILRPNLTATGDINTATPYRVEWVSRRYGLLPGIGPALPAEFVNLGGGIYGPLLTPPPASVVIGGVTIPVYDAAIVLDASTLDYGASWARTKYDDPNIVSVTNNAPATEWDPGDDWRAATATNQRSDEGPVAAAITDSLVYDLYAAQNAAAMYLDDTDNDEVVWFASGFRWYASRDPQWPVNRSLFPDTELWGGYSAPVVITGIPTTQRPTDRDWYVGTPRAVTLTFERGEFSFDFDLYPRTPGPIGDLGIGLTWDELATKYPAVTWNQLHTGFDWLDYRLVRSTAYSH
jgi:hypothetical protein